MTQWYLSFDGNQQGPMDLSQAIGQARQNPNGFAWRDGFAEWQPIASIAELNPAPGVSAPTPPPSVAPRVGADEIDFKIFGAEMQFVEVELDPGESRTCLGFSSEEALGSAAINENVRLYLPVASSENALSLIELDLDPSTDPV